MPQVPAGFSLAQDGWNLEVVCGLERRFLELDEAALGFPQLIESLLAHLRGGVLRRTKELPVT